MKKILPVLGMAVVVLGGIAANRVFYDLSGYYAAFLGAALTMIIAFFTLKILLPDFISNEESKYAKVIWIFLAMILTLIIFYFLTLVG